MNNQKDLNNSIFLTYDSILKNKFIINELSLVKLNTTSYSNVDYDKDGTQNDEVNKPLLDDINTAAKSVGIKATITTAKSGHNRTTKGSNNVSRHMNGTGVDVSILNGKGSNGATNGNNGSSEFRELGTKLKDALVKIGFTWNTESGKDKAVLWQTNTGGNHFNHLHISNRTGTSTDNPPSDSNDDINIKTDSSTTDKNSTTDKKNTDTNDKPNGKKFDPFFSGLDSIIAIARGDQKGLEDITNNPMSSTGFFNEEKATIKEEINRIKDIIKKIL